MHDFLVVVSKSRYDLLMAEHEHDHEVVMRELVFDEVRNNVVEGHKAQKNNLKYLKSLFPQQQILEERSLLTPELVARYNYIIAAGGDEHFSWVAHKAGDKPLIGYVLDERRSIGAMLSFTRSNLEAKLERILKGDYTIENWTKIAVSINDIPLEKAVSFYSFSELDGDDNSRQRIIFQGNMYEYRQSSGVHVATGAGSTGWYRQLHGDVFRKEDSFGKEERVLRLFARETGSLENRKFVIEQGDELTIVSYYDASGKARPDAIKELTYPFRMGYIAKVRVADETLKVVRTDF